MSRLAASSWWSRRVRLGVDVDGLAGRSLQAGGVGPSTIPRRGRTADVEGESKLMPDVGFVLLTVALFAALALAVRAVERL